MIRLKLLPYCRIYEFVGFGAYIFCFLGLIIGSLPLILLNIASFIKFGYFVSLENTANNCKIFSNNFFLYFIKYISLGAGSNVKNFI